MCMFSRRVEHVSATKIFAGVAPDGRQTLIYSMTVSVAEPLAMVLPLPVPANGPDDAVEFVNLEGYPELFADLKKAFPDQTLYPQALGRSRAMGPPSNTLEVHSVGAFVASYVPHPRDFGRLDPQFRLAPGVLDALPQYADWGFAVFQLDHSKQQPIQPMAMRFPRRAPASIYFPLTHVHDGTSPAEATFDHALYAQLPELIAAVSDWTPSSKPLGHFVDNRAKHVIDVGGGGHVKALFGDGPNQDLWMHAPAGIALDDLRGGGTSYRYRVHAHYLFAAPHHQYPRWSDTATKLPALCRGLREGLEALTAHHAQAWQLGPVAQGDASYFMNGNQLWRGSDYMTGRREIDPVGRGWVVFRPFSNSVEPQEITIAFATMPNEEDARDINRALCQLLEQIAQA